MTTDELTPAEREAVQLWMLRRWLAQKRCRGVRRKTDNKEGINGNGTRWGWVPAKPRTRDVRE